MLNTTTTKAQHWLRVKTESRVMSEDIDALISCALVDHLKPKRILEYGPYLGGWCVLCNGASDYSAQIHAVDTFWLTGQAAPDRGLPTNPEQLETYIRAVDRQVNGTDRPIDIKIFQGRGDEWYNSEETKYDLIRIDSEGESQRSFWLTLARARSMLAAQGLIIIDDVQPMHFAKLHGFFRAWSEGLIYPVIYGHNSIVSVIDPEDRKQIYSRLKPMSQQLGLKEVINITNTQGGAYYAGSWLSPEKSHSLYISNLTQK